eukprot:COSAG01_NODE_3038_length_6684_cov_114.904480_3_plen_90_part_00
MPLEGHGQFAMTMATRLLLSDACELKIYAPTIPTHPWLQSELQSEQTSTAHAAEKTALIQSRNPRDHGTDSEVTELIARPTHSRAVVEA